MTMTASQLDRDYVFHLDPFGQQPGLWNLYTQLTWCYPMPDGTSQDFIVSTLTKGFERLSASFPWIAGQVVKQSVQDGGGDENVAHTSNRDRHYYVVKPLEHVSSHLIVKDLTKSFPSWTTYQDSKFPMRLLDENEIAPRNTKPVSDESDPKPVLVLQATFIDGGLFLTFSAQHGTLDIVGQGEMIRLFDKACKGGEFTPDELELGNRDRRTIVKLLEEGEEQQSIGSEHNDTKGTARTTDTEISSHTDSSESAEVKPASTSNTAPSILSPAAKNIWSNFSFSTDSLAALKKHAMDSTSVLPSGFISTDDALSAFIWQRITRARSPRYQSPQVSPSTNETTFARTVDVRRYLSVPSTYPGNLATKTHTTYTIPTLLEEPLGLIASRLRQSIDPKTSDLGYQARKSATEIMASLHPRQTTESSLPSYQARPQRKQRDLSRDIAFSSWSKIDYCWILDFALGLGEPVSVRRPSFAPPGEEPMEGLVYLLPKRPDGEIGVVICLREDDMDRLKRDETWSRSAGFIG